MKVTKVGCLFASSSLLLLKTNFINIFIVNPSLFLKVAKISAKGFTVLHLMRDNYFDKIHNNHVYLLSYRTNKQ